MIRPDEFVHFLAEHGIRFFTGVPCSYFKEVIRCLEDTSKNYHMAPNEGAALALASGACLGGEGAAVMIQNSGLGNLINPLTSLCMIYKIPVALFISGRAYGIPDEPQHEIMGAKMAALLDSLEVPHWDLPQTRDWKKPLAQGLQMMRDKKSPAVFFVRKGTFDKYLNKKTAAGPTFPMKRAEAIKIAAEYFQPEDLVFATTGKISRELFALADRPGNFYMQGSMGHIAAIALGAAMSLGSFQRPQGGEISPLTRDFSASPRNDQKRVIVLDGDGAFLMHMGAASMIGHYKPENFIHLILDNESYESTGDQGTTAATSDLAVIAKACGYSSAADVVTETDFRKKMEGLFKTKGPSFLRVKINRLETNDIPRITTKYSASQIAENFAGHMARQAALPAHPAAR